MPSFIFMMDTTKYNKSWLTSSIPKVGPRTTGHSWKLFKCWDRSNVVLRQSPLSLLDPRNGQSLPLLLYTVEAKIWNKLTSDLQWTRSAVPLLAGLSSLPNRFVFCPFGHQDFASFSGHLILTVIWNYFLAGTVISKKVPHDSKKQRMQTCYPFFKSPECWIWRIFKLQLFRIFIIDFFSFWLVCWKYTHIRTK